MNRDILALDFYGKTIVAALASHDEDTDTLRVRYVLQHHSDAFNGAFVRERSNAQDELTRVFAQISEYTERTPLVIVGVRGNFLSFRHGTGFTYTESRSRIIRADAKGSPALTLSSFVPAPNAHAQANASAPISICLILMLFSFGCFICKIFILDRLDLHAAVLPMSKAGQVSAVPGAD